jgi:hypothetical protein
MAYTFSKVETASLTVEDLRPLVESSLQQLEHNIRFPVEADTQQLKMSFLEQMLQLILRTPSTFVMKIMDDDLIVSYNIGNVLEDTYQNRLTFLGPNKAGSTLWAWRDDISQARYDFLTSHDITRVSAYFPVGSNIPAAMDLLSCYQQKSREAHLVTVSIPGWTFEPFDSELITYLLVNPSAQ